MRVLDFLGAYPFLPMSIERRGAPSRGELRRWCRAHSVLLNGSRVSESDTVPNETLGIWQLVFFPDNPVKQCTMVQEIIRVVPIGPPPTPPRAPPCAADGA